ALKRLHAAREEWAEAAEVSEREITVTSELGARQTGEKGAVPEAPPPGFTGAFKLPEFAKEDTKDEKAREGEKQDEKPATEASSDSSGDGIAQLLPDLGELHLALGELYERRLKKRPP